MQLKMGNKESKKESRQVAKLRKEVEKVPDRITEGVARKVESLEDVVVIRYEDLEDPTTLVDSSSHFFENPIAHAYLKQTTALIFKSLRSAKEMRSMDGWSGHTKTFASKGKIYGMEVHYTARGLQKSTSSSSVDLQLMLGYKVTVNIMEGNPKDYPERSDLIALESSRSNLTIKSKPNESEMLELLGKDIRPIWMVFAVHLNIDPELRDQIKEECERNSKMCLLQVVQRWLKEEEGTGDLPRTWTTIASAVEKCGCGDLASRVKDMHLKSSSNTE